VPVDAQEQLDGLTTQNHTRQNAPGRTLTTRPHR
jgi:hypothetical protein